MMQIAQQKTQSSSRAARLRFALQMAEQAQKVGARIAYEREARGWSRPEMAREMPGLATGNDVYRWETGKHVPRTHTLEAVAELFGIDVADLYAGVPRKKSEPDLSDALKDAEPDDRLSLAEKKLNEALELLHAHIAATGTATAEADPSAEAGDGMPSQGAAQGS